MPKYIKINVEDHRLIDNGRVCEDVTEVVIPDLEHPTTAIENISGLAGNLELPNPSKFNAAEFSINHNNGINCEYLCDPETHNVEFRTVRQKYNAAGAVIGHESVKYRLRGAHKSTGGETINIGNPIGNTERYSALRYEKIVDGKQVLLVDWLANKVIYNGVDHSTDISKFLV